MAAFYLPDGYVERPNAAYFDDAALIAGDVIHQPEVYDAADYLARASGRSTILDLGCGSGRKLQTLGAARRIGVDFGRNLAFSRQHHANWGEWVEADLSQPSCASLASLADDSTVVVCADVIEHLPDPTPLLSLLAACHRRGAIVVTSTPDRTRNHGDAHRGPPQNPAHIREWALGEYEALLSSRGLGAEFAGYTVNNNVSRDLKTIATIHDPSVRRAMKGLGDIAAPLAILSSFNEADIIFPVVIDLIFQGCDVVAIDNWSTDQTWANLEHIAARYPGRVTLERFPPDGPPAHFEWRQILRRKEEIAAAFPGRWILHTDADEIRRSPFPTLNLAEALRVAQRWGANRVDFNLINFRPTDQAPYRGAPLREHFTHFEYGTKPGHFVQRKAWLQGAAPVDLASSGGHTAAFPGARDFPYRFLLKHYPIRSQEHGARKVIFERQPRWSPGEKALGWHVQYDHYSAGSDFTWRADALHRFDDDFWRGHGLAVMTDIAEKRVRPPAG